MHTTTVRVSETTRDELRRMSEETGQSIQAVIAAALDAYRRDRFFAELDAGYEALWADPEAQAEELAERRLWEGTLADGLDD